MSYDTVIPFFETFGRLLVDAAAPQSGERVLDLACGRGASTLPAAAAVGPAGRVVGVDLAPEMVLATAAALSAPGMRHGETRLMDAERLDFPRACFDVVLCGFGVFFFPHPAAAVAEIRRVLDPQTGRFAASTFVRGVGGYRWAADVVRGLGRQRPSFPGPIKTAVELVELLSEAGLPANVSTAQARFVFPGVDDYLGWLWSHDGRRVLEQLSAEERVRHRDASATHLAEHVVPGGYELVQAIDLTVARPHQAGGAQAARGLDVT